MTNSIEGLDSATPPTLAQAQCAVAAGYLAWPGYLPPSDGWHSAVWPLSAFDAVRQAGMETAGIIFGPDAGHAITVCRQYQLGLGFLDVEASDPGQYAPGWGDAIRAAGLRAGCYGLRRTIDAFAAHFDVLWYAAEQWDSQASHGAQHTYDQVVCGVNVDRNTFGISVFTPPVPVPPASSSPRGNTVLHTISLTTDGAGDGWLLTDIPWSAFCSATLEGSWPPADGRVFPGSAHAQNRDGKVAITVSGYIRNVTAQVYVWATS